MNKVMTGFVHYVHLVAYKQLSSSSVKVSLENKIQLLKRTFD